MLKQFTKKRDICITKELLTKRPVMFVYKGQSSDQVTLKRQMIGHKLGEYSLTKKLGAKIHNSERKRKRKNKNKKK